MPNIPDPNEKLNVCMEYHFHNVPRYLLEEALEQARRWAEVHDPLAVITMIDLDLCAAAHAEKELSHA